MQISMAFRKFPFLSMFQVIFWEFKNVPDFFTERIWNQAPSTIWKRRKLAPGRAVPHQAGRAMPQPVPGEIQDESSDSSSSSRSDASSWGSGAPWAGEPLEDGEQEL